MRAPPRPPNPRPRGAHLVTITSARWWVLSLVQSRNFLLQPNPGSIARARRLHQAASRSPGGSRRDVVEHSQEDVGGLRLGSVVAIVERLQKRGVPRAQAGGSRFAGSGE